MSFIYQWPTDQKLGAGVTITPSSEDADYPRANLYDSNPARAFKLDATSGNIVFDFGVATNVDVFAIVHHNLDAALANVKIQGNATDSWGAPTLNQTITIPTYERGSPRWPVNPFLDLSALSNSFRFWRLLFGTANSVDVQLGQLWFGETKRTLTNNISWGYQDGVERRIIEHETDYGVTTTYDLGAKIKTWSAEIKTSDAGMAAVEQWWDECNGRSLPTLIVPDSDVNDARLARWAEPVRLIQRDFTNNNIIRFGWREVSRGLVF